MTHQLPKAATMRTLLFALCAVVFPAAPALAADWIHWRGPNQNGYCPDTGLPESFSIRTVGKDNLLWRSDIGGRSTPLIMNGKLYLITAGEGEGVREGERVVCMNADTGALIWEQNFGVFLTDIVSSRLGWTTLTADPEAKTVFCHGTQGNVFCFDADTGAIKWERSLTEEFGRITGYGGRVVSPIYDSGLVIVGIINSSWGNQAGAANRYVALDSKDGHVVWWAEFPGRIKGTYYSSPVIAVINGVRLLITGGGDGSVHAINVRNGQMVWSYPYSAGVVNPSPIVDGNKVYISHGEQNPEGGKLGRLICLDASQIDPKTKRPKLIFEVKNLSKRFGLASSALAKGILYVPDDAGELTAFDATNGNVLWKFNYGTVSRGAPLIADGKLYIFDVNGTFSVLKLNGRRKPEELQKIRFRPKSGVGFMETHGTPVCVNGRLYFCTRENTYCIGDPNGKPVIGKVAAMPEEKPMGEAMSIRIEPAEVTTTASQSVPFRVEFLDANGRVVKAPADAKVEWSLPQPPLPPKATTAPPPLKGEIKAEGTQATVTLDKIPTQHGYVLAKAGKMTSPLARVRVAATLNYANDFEKTPEGAPPAGWVNSAARYTVKKVGDNKVLSKVNNNSRPPYARATTYITDPMAKDYVIECDVMGTEVRGKRADMGVVNSRYSLVLDGKPDNDFGGQRTLRFVAWEAQPRINHAVAYDWKPSEWYRLKFALDPQEKSTRLLGKVWKKGEAEPDKWTIEFDDPKPYSHGAAGLYGYVNNMLEVEKETPNGRVLETLPGSEIYYDNLKIAPVKK